MQKLMYAEDEEKERRISEMEKELERKGTLLKVHFFTNHNF